MKDFLRISRRHFGRQCGRSPLKHLRGLYSPPPVTWTAALVRDGKYGYYFRRSCIDEAEWKSIQDESTPFGIDCQADLRMLQQETRGPTNFNCQPRAQYQVLHARSGEPPLSVPAPLRGGTRASLLEARAKVLKDTVARNGLNFAFFELTVPSFDFQRPGLIDVVIGRAVQIRDKDANQFRFLLGAERSGFFRDLG